MDAIQHITTKLFFVSVFGVSIHFVYLFCRCCLQGCAVLLTNSSSGGAGVLSLAIPGLLSVFSGSKLSVALTSYMQEAAFIAAGARTPPSVALVSSTGFRNDLGGQAPPADFAGAQFGTFKPALADLAVAKLEPITTEMNRLMQEPAEIDRILGEGAERADALAHPILEQVYDIVGMIRSRRR